MREHPRLRPSNRDRHLSDLRVPPANPAARSLASDICVVEGRQASLTADGRLTSRRRARASSPPAPRPGSGPAAVSGARTARPADNALAEAITRGPGHPPAGARSRHRCRYHQGRWYRRACACIVAVITRGAGMHVSPRRQGGTRRPPPHIHARLTCRGTARRPAGPRARCNLGQRSCIPSLRAISATSLPSARLGPAVTNLVVPRPVGIPRASGRHCGLFESRRAKDAAERGSAFHAPTVNTAAPAAFVVRQPVRTAHRLRRPSRWRRGHRSTPERPTDWGPPGSCPRPFSGGDWGP
jgi:hypothetical protein